jgi:hypothetical protein
MAYPFRLVCISKKQPSSGFLTCAGSHPEFRRENCQRSAAALDAMREDEQSSGMFSSQRFLDVPLVPVQAKILVAEEFPTTAPHLAA